MSSPIFAPVLQTPRLALILFNIHNPVHYDNVLAVVNDPKVIAIMGDMEMRTHANCSRFLRSTRLYPKWMPPNLAPGQDDYATWSIYLKPNPSTETASGTDSTRLSANEETLGSFVGLVSFGQRSAEIPPDMGWAVLPPFWRQGIATEAGAAIWRHATQDLGMRDFIAFPLETNVGSIQTAKKIGFVDGGKIRDQQGKQHLLFVRPDMDWSADEDGIVNLKGDRTEEEAEGCPCSRCEDQEKQ